MSDIAIKAENVGKLYRLGQIGTGTIGQDLNRWWAKVRGKEDPFAIVGETNDRTTKGDSNYVWALKDVNFEIKKGEAVGIIGRNGAGKSTLLKLLSKVTKPSTGNIYVNDRIASLLEVGTGFHPEMTGRENIYLNGAILGMTKKEITRKFDEIVDFSGVERYIDTPVKRYSSGMYVRLAFAVAAHLESEILIVDEVLAVGDAEFQKKCLGKMGDVSRGEGRTVLFVSHQMGSVASLCNTGLLFENGRMKSSGTANEIIEEYLSPRDIVQTARNSYILKEKAALNKTVYFQNVDVLNSKGLRTDSFGFNENIILRLSIIIKENIRNVIVGVGIQDKFNTRVCTFMNELTNLNLDISNRSDFKIEIKIPANIIAPNSYSFILALYSYNETTYDIVENVCPIKIHDTGTIFSKYEGIDYGNIIIDSEWSVIR